MKKLLTYARVAVGMSPLALLVVCNAIDPNPEERDQKPMFQAIKNTFASLSNHVSALAARCKIDSMSVDYGRTGNYIDDLGKSWTDNPTGINEAWERFYQRFPVK